MFSLRVDGTGHNSAFASGTGERPKLRQAFAHDSEFAAKVKQRLKCELLEESQRLMSQFKLLPALRGWLKRVPLVVALMSGIFSLCRELYGIYGGHILPKTLFWSFVWIAFIVSSAIAWFQEHERVVRLESNAKSPDIDVQLKEVALQPQWAAETGIAWVIVRIRLHNTTPECPTTIDDYQIFLTIDGKEYGGQVHTVDSFTEIFASPIAVQNIQGKSQRY